MPLEIVTVPCLSDNYAFLAHDPATGDTAVVDVPEARPILAELAKRGWTATDVLLTHHHWDHVDGLAELLASHPAHVYGAAADEHRLPKLDTALCEAETVRIGTQAGTVIDVSGHTNGHIAYHFPESSVVFTADSLMALGCGRLFEGTPDQMWQSLSKLAALPADTMVCSGHEYTQSNANFAVTVDPNNPDLAARVAEITKLRAQNLPTVPSRLDIELRTNPFLRASDPAIRAHLKMQDAPDSQVFARIRQLKDDF